MKPETFKEWQKRNFSYKPKPGMRTWLPEDTNQDNYEPIRSVEMENQSAERERNL